jgi:anthranilate/para-aminobenzoate synthase component II
MRYHSLVVEPASLPPTLAVTAWAADRAAGAEIMGLQHSEAPVFGVQFHPESIGTDVGMRILKNFLALLDGARLAERG